MNHGYIYISYKIILVVITQISGRNIGLSDMVEVLYQTLMGQ